MGRARGDQAPEDTSDTVRRRAAWVVVLLTAAAVALLFAAVGGEPGTRVVGRWQSEAPWHIWRYAAYLESLGETGPWMRPPQRMPIDPDVANLMPASTLWGWPAFALAGGGVAGVAWAWNLQYLMAVLASGLGGWWLGRLLVPRAPWAAVGLSGILLSSAVLHQAPGVGRLETTAQFLLPAAWAALLWACAAGGGWLRRLGRIAVAAALFAAVTLQGGYPALFAGLLAVPVGLVALWRAPSRTWAVVVLGAVAAAGAAALWPWVAVHRASPPAALAGGPRPLTVDVPLSTLLPWTGEAIGKGFHVVPYFGWALLALAVWGAVRSRPSRAWLAMGAGVGWVMLWGLDLGALGVPVSGWSRIGTALPALLGLAALPVLASGRWTAWLGAGVVAVETLGWALWWHGPPAAWSLAPPAALTELRDSGATQVVHLPMDAQSLVWAHVADTDQGRAYPVARRVEVPARRERVDVPLLTWLHMVLPGDPFSVGADLPLPGALGPGCVSHSAWLLAGAGYDGLLVRPDGHEAEVVDGVVARLSDELGPPTVQAPTGIGWLLPGAATPDATCEGGIELKQRPPPLPEDDPRRLRGKARR